MVVVLYHQYTHSGMILQSEYKGSHYQCHLIVASTAQGIYSRPGIKCKNGSLEIASQIIDRFYFVDQIFAQFFLLDESCIYSAHVGT